MQRRQFFSATLGLSAATCLAAPAAARLAGLLADLEREPRSPADLAHDEDLWRAVQQAYAVDRSVVNLNNGGVSPSPRVVQEALARHLAFANQTPARNMWQVLEPRKEGVRAALARLLGCDAEEVAITRNASEGLQVCQFGFDLEPGDEVLTSTQDYPRMLNAFRQRERRDGLVLRQVALPTPIDDPAEVVRRFEAGLSDRTRLMLVSHVVFLTGAVLPVRELVALGARRGIPVIVDGAHAFAHLVFTRDELGADYYATSLHKWLAAPFGSGLLYVRRERIEGLWPLFGPRADQAGDIRKYEEIGTHSVAVPLAIAEALAFHLALGPERKLARLIHLREGWAARLAQHERVRFCTNRAPGAAGGLATFAIEGIEPVALARHLEQRHGFLVTPIEHRGVEPDDAFAGVRVSPGVYTALEEVERFADAVEDVLRRGLPA